MIPKILFSLFFYIIGGFAGYKLFGDFATIPNVILFGGFTILYVITVILCICKSKKLENDDRIRNEQIKNRLSFACITFRQDIYRYVTIFLVLLLISIFGHTAIFDFHYAIEFFTVALTLLMLACYNNILSVSTDINKTIIKEIEENEAES